MLDMSVEDYRQVVDIDLVGPFIMAKACIPGHDREGPRQDHQHLLDDERAGT
jgi:NAD(P)-dependent dehydrogenase (short-subunit alcohol dehydrogenase family)